MLTQNEAVLVGEDLTIGRPDARFLRTLVSLLWLLRFCDSEASVFISDDFILHEHTKYIEVDCHFIWLIDE